MNSWIIRLLLSFAGAMFAKYLAVIYIRIVYPDIDPGPENLVRYVLELFTSSSAFLAGSLAAVINLIPSGIIFYIFSRYVMDRRGWTNCTYMFLISFCVLFINHAYFSHFFLNGDLLLGYIPSMVVTTILFLLVAYIHNRRRSIGEGRGGS